MQKQDKSEKEEKKSTMEEEHNGNKLGMVMRGV